MIYLRLNGIGEFNTIQIIANSFLMIKEHIYSKLCGKRLENNRESIGSIDGLNCSSVIYDEVEQSLRETLGSESEARQEFFL